MNDEIKSLIQQLSEKVDKYTLSAPTTTLPAEFSFVMDDGKTPRLENCSSTRDITVYTSKNGIITLQDHTKVISLLEKISEKKDLKFLYKFESIVPFNSFSVQQYIHALRIGYTENILVKSIGYSETIDFIESSLERMSIKTTKEFNMIRENSCIPHTDSWGTYTYWSWLVVPCYVTLTDKLPFTTEKIETKNI